MIDLQPSSEQQQIIDAVALFITEKLPLARHRRAELGGHIDAGLYTDIAALGWFGLGLPEEAGGAGYGIEENVLTCRELGRQLAPLGLFAAILGARCAFLCGDTVLAQDIVAGRQRVALAVFSRGLEHEQQIMLIDAPGASHAFGLTPNGAYLLPLSVLPAPDGDDQHIAIDPSVSLSTRTCTGVAAHLRVAPASFHWEALLLGSAMMAGMAEATRDMAVGYAKLREQFGQAIGAFQAIKHICADAALRAEAASCQLMFAAIETQKQSKLAPMHVTAAKLTAADALLHNAAANIQVHGGIGFTAECDAHLYMKRAHVLEQLLGSQRWHQSVMGKGQQFTIDI